MTEGPFPELEHFMDELAKPPNERKLTENGWVWIRIFRWVGRRFPEIDRQESTQLCCVALWECHRRRKGTHKGYVKRACLNEHHMHMRRHGRMAQIPKHLPAPDRRSAADVAAEALSEIDATLERMTPERGQIIRWLKAGKQCHEIAGLLGVSQRTACRRICEARNELKNLREDHYNVRIQ